MWWQTENILIKIDGDMNCNFKNDMFDRAFFETPCIALYMSKTIKVGTSEKSAPHAINFVSDNENLHNALAFKKSVSVCLFVLNII